jgi:hypothetical protein
VNLAAAAGTRVREIAGAQAVESRRVRLRAAALAHGFAVPCEAEGIQRAQDRVRRARDLAGAVDVFDPEEPLAAGGASVQPAADGRI